MARYTSTIQDILMMYCVHNHNVEPTTTKDIIATAQKDLFNFDYPFYDPLLKDEFEKQFIRHFYMREIAFESIALFKNHLEDYLWLNMEKWAVIYQKFNGLDPFINYDVKTDRKTDEDETKNQDVTRTQTLENSKDESQTNLLDTTGNTKEKNNVTGTVGEKGSSKSDTTSDSKDFTRQLDETTPDDRLTITANDGTGIIQYADSINETRGTTNQTENTNASTTTDTTTKTDETKERDDVKNQVEDRHLHNVFEQNQNENETKGNTRAFLQELAERKHGKIGNSTYMSMYQEFINNFDSINKQMFREIKRECFIGLLN